MNELELPQNTVLLGEREYATAIDVVITQAQEQLLFFDQDCSVGDFASIKRFDLLTAFLNKSDLTKLTIILHHTDFFTAACPRLFSLLSTFSHKMVVYQTNDHAKIAKDCFILADDKAYISRFHIDQARCKYALNDVEKTASLAERFDELLLETTRTISATKLGL